MASELAVGRLPTAIVLPDGGNASLLPEAPDEAVGVEVQKVLKVGLLALPVHRAGVEADVVQGHLGQEFSCDLVAAGVVTAR